MLLSLGFINPSTKRIISIMYQIPRPPSVINLPIPIPVCPIQHLSTANMPKNIEYNRVDMKYLSVYLKKTKSSRIKCLLFWTENDSYFTQGTWMSNERLPRHSIPSNTVHVTVATCTSECLLAPHYARNI